MNRLAVVALAFVALALGGLDARPSGADFVATAKNLSDVFTSASDFNTVVVTLADPGSPLQGTWSLNATASSDRGLDHVTIQRAPAGGGTWTDVCTDDAAPFNCAWDTTAATDGAYDLRAIATDAAGYTRTSSVVASRVVDNDGPTVTLADPGPYLQGTVGLQVTASDTVGLASFAIEYRPTGGSGWTPICTTGASPRTCPFNTTGVADGDVDLRATATDTNGHTTTTTPITRRVDNTAPTTTLSDPGTMRGTVTLSASAGDDAGTGVASVAIQYRTSPNGAWQTACTTSAVPYSCPLATTTLADGLYDLRSLATDGTGLSTASAVLSARRVDNTAPASTLTNPGTPLRGTVTVAGTATDGGSGAASWALQRRPSGGGSWTTICSDASSPYSCDWDTTGVADGLYDLQAVTTDNAGNATPSTAVTSRRVDNTAPTVALADPGSPKTGTFTLTATVSDTGSGVASVVFERRVTGTSTWTTMCTDTVAPYTCSFASAGVQDDAYDFRATATDVAGNVAASVVGARIMNNTLPTPTDVEADNGTGTATLADTGDLIVFSFNEPLQPASVLAGWDGSAGTAVCVRLLDSGNLDTFQIWNGTNTTQSRLTTGGAVAARKLVSANLTFNATIAQTARGVYAITLGSVRTGSAASADLTSQVNLSWPAAAGFLDLAGTPSLLRVVTGTKSVLF